MVKAGIDLGTNTVRLLIKDSAVLKNNFANEFREIRIVRLGEGIDKTKKFTQNALHRTFKALSEYEILCKKHSVKFIKFVATSASRDAINKNELINGIYKIFKEPIWNKTNFQFSIINGIQEGTLSFIGATNNFINFDNPKLVIDIGGGSTEFSFGNNIDNADDGKGDAKNYGKDCCKSNDKSDDKNKKVQNLTVKSLNIGAVRITEKFFNGNVVPNKQEIINATNFIDFELNKVDYYLKNAKTVIGVAGTITSFCMYHLNLTNYTPNKTNGYIGETTDFINSINKMLKEEMLELLKYMPPKRADVIKGGILIFLRILKKLKSPQVIISENDLLDSLVKNQ
jgi:exopolyphosphatase/guanosine-5'-triphosphate,3'-diphosphate pyrophosphatase